MIVAAICARGGSKGVARKNLRPLCGKPLLAYAIESARACALVDRIVVSTDDAEIADAARSYGADVPFMRPAELAQDTSPKWPVFRHLVSWLEEHGGDRVEVLADLDVAVPMREPDDIARCITMARAGAVDVAVTAYEADRNPYFNMVEERDGYAVLVKRLASTVTRRQDAPKVFALSPAVFAIGGDFLMRSSHWSEGRVRIVEMPRERAVDIDSELDLAFVELLMSRQASRSLRG